MGKRSSFERIPHDFYRTPRAAVGPLLPFLPPATRFVEPCAGDGALISHLESAGHRCVAACDLEPPPADFCPPIAWADAMTLSSVPPDTLLITNPPWTRSILHPMIEHFSFLAPTWLLFDADWMHTGQAVPFLRCCSHIVSVGRVKWIEDSASVGKDNACWYKFELEPCSTLFFGPPIVDTSISAEELFGD